jgi:positive regulator of sigma E activity
MDIFHLVKTTLTLIKLFESDIIKILEFLIDTIFMFCGRVLHQIVGIHVGVKLCSSSRQLALSFVRDRSHTRASLVKRKEARPIIKYALLSLCTLYMMSVY